MAKVRGQYVSFPHSAEAAIEDCGRARLILSTIRGARCNDSWAIAPYVLERTGVQLFWWEKDGFIRHENSADWQGTRPWNATPARPASRP
jgi:hypothetical protein